MKLVSIIKKPCKKAKINYIEDNLENLQKIVGGYIEYTYIEKLEKMGISIISNDESKINGSAPNVALLKDNNFIDTFFGNVIFIGTKETDDGTENESLTKEQIDFLEKEVFSGLMCFTKSGDILNVIKV